MLFAERVDWCVRLVLVSRRRKSTNFCPRLTRITRSLLRFASGCRRRRPDEAGTPVTAEIGPSLDFYVKSPLKFADVTAFDLDDSKSRFLVISVGYRYLPTPNTAPDESF